MSDENASYSLHFRNDGENINLEMDRDIEGIITEWSNLRRAMTREVPDGFSRDEWAYLISFIEMRALNEVYSSTFGKRIEEPEARKRILVSGTRVALWSPNNVSLLAPLTMILVSITGSRLRIKLGNEGADLCTPLVNWVRSKVKSGPLYEWLKSDLEVAQFSRSDSRGAEWSNWADVKLVFGSDAGCAAVDALPTTEHAQTFLFSDKTSRMWCTAQHMDDTAIDTLIRVFSIYGTAGCTSPRVVTILDGTEQDARTLGNRLADRWPEIVKQDIEMHHASQNVLSAQIGGAKGSDVLTIERNAAVIAISENESLLPIGHYTLEITHSTVEDAIKALPDNIQTIGHHLPSEMVKSLSNKLNSTEVKRFVPVGEMHHFGPVWDGLHFWRGLFREK